MPENDWTKSDKEEDELIKYVNESHFEKRTL